MKIAFAGLMKAGKDTAAEYILRNSSSSGAVVKFADPLYEIQKMIYDYLGLTLPPDGKDRVLLQLLGTEWGRRLDPDLWVKDFEREFNEREEEIILITDLRFPNELVMARKLGFTVVFISADENLRLERGAKSTKHESEEMMHDWDSEYLVNGKLNDVVVLENNGTLEDFYAKVKTLF